MGGGVTRRYKAMLQSDRALEPDRAEVELHGGWRALDEARRRDERLEERRHRREGLEQRRQRRRASS